MWKNSFRRVGDVRLLLEIAENTEIVQAEAREVVPFFRILRVCMPLARCERASRWLGSHWRKAKVAVLLEELVSPPVVSH